MALRPRGRAAGGPREAHVAHKARTCGRRPRMSTVHADARVGRHVAGAVGSWRAHGYSEPWLGIGGGNANALLHPTF